MLMHLRRILAGRGLWALLALAVALVIACKSGNGGTPSPGASPQLTPGATPPAAASPGATASPQLQLSPQPSPVPADRNVLAHGDFEDCPEGDTPCGAWFALKPPDFELSDVAHGGDTSAHLKMRDPDTATGAKVYYLVQEVNPTEFPEVISGYYRVENWVKGTPKQYLQFVVIVWGATNAPENSPGQRFPNHQIRYLEAGIDQDPFAIANAKFFYISKDDPVEGTWVPFKVNVKQDFLDQWGAVPEGYERIRLLFEVRYDDKLAESPSEADVYYDDLYFGPAAGATVP